MSCTSQLMIMNSILQISILQIYGIIPLSIATVLTLKRTRCCRPRFPSMTINGIPSRTACRFPYR